MLDLASVHTGQHFRRQMKEELPHVAKVYIPAGYTSVCQPLDRAIFRGEEGGQIDEDADLCVEEDCIDDAMDDDEAPKKA